MSDALRSEVVTRRLFEPALRPRVVVRRCPNPECGRVLLRGRGLAGVMMLKCRDCKTEVTLRFEGGQEVGVETEGPGT